MKTLIVYKSQHGATKQYAEWIHEEVKDSDLFEADYFNTSNINKYSNIIIGSSVYGGQMASLPFLTANFDNIKDKKIFFFTVGLIPASNGMSKKMFETIPAEIREKIEYIKLPGQITYMKPNFIQRWIFKTFLKGDVDSLIDRSYIKPIVDFLK